MYSSQFQMGFVARVFDFLFAEGPNILFKISLAVLSIHKPILLTCLSFESIVDHVKITIPEMSLIESELIINKAYNYNIENNLMNYEIEFNILSEEYDMNQGLVAKECNESNLCSHGFDEMRYNQLENENYKLKVYIRELSEKLKAIENQHVNQEDALQKLQHENNQLKCKVNTLEIEREMILKKVKDQEKKLSLKIIN